MANTVHIPHPYLGDSVVIGIYTREVEYTFRRLETDLIPMLDRILTDGANVWVDHMGNVLWA